MKLSIGNTLFIPVINNINDVSDENNTGASLHVDLNFAYTYDAAELCQHNHELLKGRSGSIPDKGKRFSLLHSAQIDSEVN
jgi:hypothetical protein